MYYLMLLAWALGNNFFLIIFLLAALFLARGKARWTLYGIGVAIAVLTSIGDAPSATNLVSLLMKVALLGFGFKGVKTRCEDDET